MRRILICGLLLVAQAIAAEEPGPARGALLQFSEGLETLHAAFEQRVITTDGQLDSEGTGEVWLQQPDRFRWSYGGDYPELIVADGKHVWIYDEMLEQVTVKPQSAQAEDSPLMLLTRPESLDQQFTVSELGEHEGMHILALGSQDPESEFERILLGFSDHGLGLMVLEDAFGLRTEIRFSSLQRNQGVAEELFRFEAPEGTDVVGDIATDTPQ